MRKAKKSNTAANLGFEAKLWQTADALRNNMDAAEYKHVVLGLIFLKYISDAFEAKHADLNSQRKQGADSEDPDEYRAASIFWVPKEARWPHLKANAPQPTIGKLVDDAMSAIERDNPSLKGVLPKDYARPGLDKQRLGQIINHVSDIAMASTADRAKDTLGRVYEYFLARNKKNGRFRDRRGGTLFLDARKMGTLVDRVHRELNDGDIAKIAGTYHAWRGDKSAGEYADVPGFCKAATIEDIRKHGHVLTPGRYVGAEAVEDDGEPFEEKMKRLTATLREQQAEAAKLDAAIAANLKELGYGGR
jgi:type I restriction-modification system DNA methylase subunit